MFTYLPLLLRWTRKALDEVEEPVDFEGFRALNGEGPASCLSLLMRDAELANDLVWSLANDLGWSLSICLTLIISRWVDNAPKHTNAAAIIIHANLLIVILAHFSNPRLSSCLCVG